MAALANPVGGLEREDFGVKLTVSFSCQTTDRNGAHSRKRLTVKRFLKNRTSTPNTTATSAST
jgi:hypothetical protein